MTGTKSETPSIKRIRPALGVRTNGCNGYCDDSPHYYKNKFVKGSRYEKGQLYCSRCRIWISKEAITVFKGMKLCGCCHSRLRTKSPHSKKEFKSQNGDRSFNYFNVAMAELQNGCKTLHLYYKCDNDLGKARVESLCKNIGLVKSFLKEIKKYKRQRSERILNKYYKLVDLLEKTVKKMPNM